jgi:glycogen debranching enzyme
LVDVNSPQQFYITATSTPVDDRPRVLKYGDLFAVFNRHGDIEPSGLGEQGLYHEDTRFLSQFILHLGDSLPLLLSSTITTDNFLFIADLTNIDILDEEQLTVPRGTLHLHRARFLLQGTCYDKLRIANYGLSPVSVPLRLTFAADFADMFEVRGTRRANRGTLLEGHAEGSSIVLDYEGLDRVIRSCRMTCSPAPTRISSSEILFRASLEPKQEFTCYLTASCESSPRGFRVSTWSGDWERACAAARKELSADPLCNGIRSSNEDFNNWVNRSVADVQMMIRGNPESGYPYAGVPWFNTVFGRDGIITALACLWLVPSVARGVLRHLAATQATRVDPESDAEPGKIMHEMRRGEMANLREVPFGCYYGSVDATPLFVVLAGAYYDRTGDRSFIESLWPHVEAALSWINAYGDEDGDGFVEYSRHSAHGLVQQGWKDSHDSVFHADGRLAEPPIALCEVQGYVHAAKRAAARLAVALGHAARAASLESEATALQAKFDEAFWCPDIEMYVIALDGRKNQCRVRTSNAGHCLYTGTASFDHARLVAHHLLGPDFFSGWGVRTVSSSEVRYNPLSYHNGSVWPHENALIASGLSKYGFKDLALRIVSGLLDASVHVDLHRMPELFCGLHRRNGEGPTLYPVACSPQAWAAASVFLLLEACLGISINGDRRQIVFDAPRLPDNLSQLWIKGLEISESPVDLFLESYQDSVRVELLENPGKIDVDLGL